MARILFFLLTIFFSSSVPGQIANTFNLNINNGLPSNHVYNVIVDAHGYLWIATEKGVVRYNGYEYKVFDLSDGLPTTDIWELFEDKKGRIWAGSISDDIGYIYNSKYHSAILRGFGNMIYPSPIRDTKNGVFFTTCMQPCGLCIENSDTITNYPITDSLYTTTNHPNFLHSAIPVNWYSSNADYSLLRCDSVFYKIQLKNKKLSVRQILNIGTDLFFKIRYSVMFIINNHIISYSFGTSTEFLAINLHSGATREIDIRKYGNYGNINFISPERFDSTFYVVTTHNILHFKSGNDNDIKFIRSYEIDNLVSGNDINDDNKIRPVHINPFWGMCLGTINNGLWINYNIKNNFVPQPEIDLDNYTYLGGIGDSAFYWWNNDKKILALFGEDLKVVFYSYKNINTTLSAVVPYNKDTLIVVGKTNYFLDIKTKKIEIMHLRGASSIITQKPYDIIATTAVGLITARFIPDSALNHYITLNKKRYIGLVYDSIRKNFWAFNSDNVFIHNSDRKTDTLLSKEKLSLFGVTKIEKIIIDNKYGNIFFQGNGGITMYNYEKKSYNKLFEKYNLKEVATYVCGTNLIVIGRLGVLFVKIGGHMQVSEPLLYPNVKNINYSYIYGCQVSSKNILLNTDKGVYSVNIPPDSEILQQRNDNIPYKFIVNYKNSTVNTTTGDTIAIDQTDLRLQFDVINPLGTGKVKYRYQLSGDSSWHELNANELTLPQLPPGKYCFLSIIASDNAWKSNNIDMYLYVHPYWWQTNVGRKIVWVMVFLLIIILFAIAVIVTRKLVLRATAKRNMQMELELKAIYAQINPHFIFNTLNTALLLVRKKKFEEAYTHISQFSRLLRSYMKSSRNKLITIADEIINLEDYLELQRTRFGHKFEYIILVDNTINPKQIKIPSLLLQPFVENAINHGLLPKEEPGHLKIEFATGVGKNEIICSIDDDGIGREQARLENKDSVDKQDSYGDLLIEDLVNIFNRYERMNIIIEYLDKEHPLTGTMVTIQIKNPHSD